MAIDKKANQIKNTKSSLEYLIRKLKILTEDHDWNIVISPDIYKRLPKELKSNEFVMPLVIPRDKNFKSIVIELLEAFFEAHDEETNGDWRRYGLYYKICSENIKKSPNSDFKPGIYWVILAFEFSEDGPIMVCRKEDQENWKSGLAMLLAATLMPKLFNKKTGLCIEGCYKEEKNPIMICQAPLILDTLSIPKKAV